MSWEDFVTERVFGPLCMTSSYPSTARLQRDRGVPDDIQNIFLPAAIEDTIATSTEWSGMNSFFSPAGGVITTADDIARWMIMHLQEGEYGGRRVLSAESVREMHRPQVVAAPVWGVWDWGQLHNPRGHFITYGLGWFSYDYRDRKVDEHTGLATNRCSIAVVPEEGLGVAVCTNACTSSPDIWRDMRMTGALKLQVIDCFLGAPDTDWSTVFWESHQQVLKRQARQ
jgi:CubicO group peptidase (beta-lactamase class C family)